MSVGIDDIAIHFPKLYLDMKDFANMRDVDYGKLNKGLGLSAMAIPDVHEDTATMGANAVVRLIDRNGIKPTQIGRIYLGTESAFDGAKPTATYILDMLTQRYSGEFGKECFQNCDVVDMKFACIGAVDALHNTLDWVARGGEKKDRIGIVVFSDNAKYDLESTGEYTQGAGGGALCVRYNPRLISIPDRWGISTAPVHDFFKPRRDVSIKSVISHVMQLAQETGVSIKEEGIVERMVRRLPKSTVRGMGIFSHGVDSVQIHRDEPVFDGPFSNRCYQHALEEAFRNFCTKAEIDGRWDPEGGALTEDWARIIMHLPYAFHAKRVFPVIFAYERRGSASWSVGPPPSISDFNDMPDGHSKYIQAFDAYRRNISKTKIYQDFHTARFDKGQRASSLIGNQYTGSIFLAMMSTFELDYEADSQIDNSHFGFCGYGSGAKAKVFEGVVNKRWKEVVAKWNIFGRMADRIAIDQNTYKKLHKGIHEGSVLEPCGEFVLVGIKRGVRTYAWIDDSVLKTCSS